MSPRRSGRTCRTPGSSRSCATRLDSRCVLVGYTDVPPASDLDLLRQANAADTRLHAAVLEEFRARVAGLSAELQAAMRRYLDELTVFRATPIQGD